MTIRPATAEDARDMTTLLNEIIAIGDTTAHQTPFDEDRMIRHYIAPDDLISCHVAETENGVVGFQWLGWPDPAYEDLPRGWATIASFVAQEVAGQGIGKRLFAATVTSAMQAGVKTIDATIRADNLSGLRYYGSIGFSDYGRLENVTLSDGTIVDKLQKRFEVG